MVVIQPSNLFRREILLIDQFAAHGHHRHVLETEPGLFAEGVRCFDFPGHDDVCDGD